MEHRRRDQDEGWQTTLPLIDETKVVESAAAASRKNHGDEGDDDDDLDLNSFPLWQQAEDDGWELTWPIWHMLPRQERKDLAHKHGYKSIGAFEEYMSLQQAERDSSLGQSHVTKPYANSLIYPSDSKAEGENKTQTGCNGERDAGDGDKKMPALDRQNSSISAGPDSNGSVETEQDPQQTKDALLSLDELVIVGGEILRLPEELIQQVFDWLPVDMYGTLALVSPHWKHLTRTETVYRRLCERLYLKQSKKRELHVSRFGNSYRNMLLHRPRVRAAGGCYVLKYSHVKRIQRDMWTEIPVGAILETVYYRYLYFQEDGRVLYALTPSPPHEMFRRLLRVCLHQNKKDKDFKDDKTVVWGTFQVQKNNVTIVARQSWHTIRFDLTIQDTTRKGGNNETNGDISHEEGLPGGKFGRLKLDRHLSSASGCFEDWSADRVEYKLPEECFMFVKSSRL